MTKMDKPTVLLLGGCGFIGRNLVAYLIENDLVKFLRIVDKVPPQVAWLNPKHQDYFNNHLVEFKSANLINTESCQNAFLPLNGSTAWDYVFNCAGETKPGQTDPVYKEGILKLSLNCAQQAALSNVKHYVEISSGQVFSSDKHPIREDGPIDPWTFIAKWKAEVESQLKEIPNLNYTIVRPAVVYGLGDKTGLMPRIMVASIYKHLGETLKFLWNGDLKINTLHVDDLCCAIWFLCNRDDTIKQTYHVVDDADSTQHSIGTILEDLFNIKVDYYGSLVSKAVDLEVAADEGNDKHLKPWAEACRRDDIQNTPLSPHMESEVLLHKHLNLDGTKLKNLGFKISVPRPTVQSFKEIVQDYVEMKVFPRSLAP